MTYRVNVTELRSYRVTYIVEAADAEEARWKASVGDTVNVIDDDEFEYVEDRRVGRAVEVN